METFLGGLGILLVGGMVTASIKYPKGYVRLCFLLSGLSIGLSVALASYMFGLWQAVRQIYPLLGPGKLEQAKVAVIEAYPSMWLAGANLAFMLFSVFLLVLPKILGAPENNDK